jgi:hypothetical protein
MPNVIRRSPTGSVNPPRRQDPLDAYLEEHITSDIEHHNVQAERTLAEGRSGRRRELRMTGAQEGILQEQPPPHPTRDFLST